MKDRVLTIVLSVISLVALGVIVVFLFGTPQGAPQVAGAGGGTASPAAPPMGEAGLIERAASEGSEAATGSVPAPDPSSPLAIEIPGCVCHSDDPQLVEEHSQYRMNQCFGCHAGGMPEMGG